ncbi:hypothetical protein K474DRAFT_1680880 [Panus rudis PR-1116 ss-1]|nr:hypothetical protein K474DRAFT_1680880 [Panus rudis PR-1116 ss-1]
MCLFDIVTEIVLAEVEGDIFIFPQQSFRSKAVDALSQQSDDGVVSLDELISKSALRDLFECVVEHDQPNDKIVSCLRAAASLDCSELKRSLVQRLSDLPAVTHFQLGMECMIPDVTLRAVWDLIELPDDVFDDALYESVCRWSRDVMSIIRNVREVHEWSRSCFVFEEWPMLVEHHGRSACPNVAQCNVAFDAVWSDIVLSRMMDNDPPMLRSLFYELVDVPIPGVCSICLEAAYLSAFELLNVCDADTFEAVEGVAAALGYLDEDLRVALEESEERWSRRSFHEYLPLLLHHNLDIHERCVRVVVGHGGVDAPKVNSVDSPDGLAFRLTVTDAPFPDTAIVLVFLTCYRGRNLDAFLLPSDDPRIHQASEKLTPGTCKLPDYAWQDWGVQQVERVWDLSDISLIRAASKNVDPSYKT